MEKIQRKKEFKIIIVIVIILTLLSALEFKFFKSDSGFKINSALVFFIMNLNLILLLLLIFLILRNLVKLYYERKTEIPGSKIKTRLLMAFILITLIPNAMLFISSVNFINSSIAYWFNAPVEQALKNSIEAGHEYYKYIEKNHTYFINQNLGLFKKSNTEELKKLIDSSPFDFVEIYSKEGKRLKLAIKQDLEREGEIPESRIHNIEKFPATITKDTGSLKVIKTIVEKNGIYISAGVAADLKILTKFTKISEGYDEYQQIKLMKNSVKTTYILALFLVSFLVLFSAVWFAFYFSKTITDPIMELVNATRIISKGNLDLKLKSKTDDEIGTLVNAFNEMTLDLKSAKITVQKQNEEFAKRTRYIETILRNISTGVVAIDSNGTITAANMAFGNIFKTDYSTITGNYYKDVLPKKYCELAQRYITPGTKVIEEEIPVQLQIENDMKNLLLRFSSLHDENGKNLGIVTVSEDVTELEKAQRMAAWREVARQIAHEVKNPLTPISLAAQRLQRKFPDLLEDKIFSECTKTIIDHVGIMRSLVNEFASYARFPSPQRVLSDFKDVLGSTIPLYMEKYPEIEFNVSTPEKLPKIFMDKRQISQAVINLVENAAAAMNGKGTLDIETELKKNKKVVSIKFSDSGPGVTKDKRTRLFEPYFSTKKAGTGLGLTIVNSIVTAHDGTITLDESQTGGACFIIELPV
ncbi:MAG: PAS domain-containing protein [Desulfobacteraceae bacterium]|nr:PAS domain-containing protein [Desulfobacteraceae bacterium]